MPTPKLPVRACLRTLLVAPVAEKLKPVLLKTAPWQGPQTAANVDLFWRAEHACRRKFGLGRAALSPTRRAPAPSCRGPARGSFNGCFMTASLALGFDLSFDDLHSREGLARLDARFLAFLGERDGELKGRLEAARSDPASVKGDAESELLDRARAGAGGLRRRALRRRGRAGRIARGTGRPRRRVRGEAPVRAAAGDPEVRRGGRQPRRRGAARGAGAADRRAAHRAQLF